MSTAATISVRIIDGPLEANPSPEQSPGGLGRAGARVVFEGVVRAEEEGRVVRALMYEVYEPMASRTLQALAVEIGAAHGVISIVIEHSRGEVGVGECSFRLAIDASHRKEALAAMDELIDRMKKDVPIWKTPIWA